MLYNCSSYFSINRSDTEQFIVALAQAARIKLDIPIQVTATDVVVAVVAIDDKAIWVISAILIYFFIYSTFL